MRCSTVKNMVSYHTNTFYLINASFKTLNFSESEEIVDDFEKVFANQTLNYTMLGLYFLGYFGCAGLLFLSWFERSGQAGPYRTLANRLVSYTLDQVNIWARSGKAFLGFGQ